MNDSRDSGPFEKHAFAIAAGFIGAFFAIWLLDFAVVRADWCGQAKSTCVRDWLSATSGWAAAVVAVGAAGITIGPLRRQAAEAKRQTDFAVGDAAPEVLIGFGASDWIATIDIVNWNRRRIFISEITVTTESRVQITSFQIPVAGEYSPERIQQFPGLTLEGWHDRSHGPDKSRITVETTAEWIVNGPRKRRLEIDVMIILIDSEHRQMKIRASNPNLVYAN